MGKFDNIDKYSKAIKGASLKSNSQKETKNILIYNVPSEWVKILKENGFSFSSYAKMAIFDKMKKDGLI